MQLKYNYICENGEKHFLKDSFSIIDKSCENLEKAWNDAIIYP